MKSILKNTWLIVFLLIYNGSFAQSHKEIKLNKQKHKSATSAEIDPIQVIFDIDTSQMQSDKGIRFCLKIKNDSTSNIVVRNPMDFIGISLTDKTGQSVLLPYGSRVALHTSGGRFNPPIAFTAEKIVSKGKEVKSIDMANVDTINVPAKGSFDIYLNIHQCRDITSDQTYPYKIIPVPAGKYWLFIILSIISGKDLKTSETRATFVSTSLHINYGL